MKNKSEIRKKIQHLYDLKKQSREVMEQNGYPLAQLKYPFQIIDYSILALKWAIGYKTNFGGLHYFCFSCHLMHEKQTCPKCGGNKILGDNNADNI